MSTPNNKASLGCGTLILIALIVMIFGNANRDVDKDLRKQLGSIRADVGNLKSELSGLKAEIRTQSETLAKISKSLEDLKQRPAQPRPRVVAPAGSPETPPLPEAPLPEN
jgi:Sec-independent protein translocase protein TatA